MKKIIIDETVKQNRLKELEDLLLQKQQYDWQIVSQMVGLSVETVRKIYVRIGSKNHDRVVEALRTVIENRKALLETKIQ